MPDYTINRARFVSSAATIRIKFTARRPMAYDGIRKRKGGGRNLSVQRHMENRNPSGDTRAIDPSQVPVIPLPNPGESGAVFDPDNPGGGAADPGQIPVIPLLRPGEGGAVFDPDSVITDPGQIPVIPLPNPGEGGAVYDPETGTGGSIIGIQPLPSYPIYVQPNAAVRFLNTTHGYPDLRVSIDGTRVVTLLAAGEASCYNRIASGRRTVTVLGTDGYVYLQKPITFRQGRAYIVAIANRNGGIDLTAAEDTCYR